MSQIDYIVLMCVVTGVILREEYMIVLFSIFEWSISIELSFSPTIKLFSYLHKYLFNEDISSVDSG